MSRLRALGDADASYLFKCPGCGQSHVIPTTGARAWGFNEDVHLPTFTPSILARGVKNPWGPDFDSTPTVYHSFVTNGRIQFLGDCTHALAGQTVDLPEVGDPRSAFTKVLSLLNQAADDSSDHDDDDTYAPGENVREYPTKE